jgi:hypothetical protein
MGQKLVFQIPDTGVTLALFEEFVSLCKLHEVTPKSEVSLERREDGLRFMVELPDKPSKLPGRKRALLSHDDVMVLRSIVRHRIEIKSGIKTGYVAPIVNRRKKYRVRKFGNG